MSLSAIADYANSDSEQSTSSDTDELSGGATLNDSQKEATNFFEATAECSSSDTDSEHEQQRRTVCHQKKMAPTTGLLPKPSFNTVASSIGSSSVFHNPFREEEEMATQLLQKHVSMTELQEKSGRKERKIICKAFKKGYCKRGAKCPFVHVQPQASSGDPTNSSGGGQRLAPAIYASEATLSKSEAIVRTKKRVGVSNSLVPPRKAMKAYEKLKE